MLLRDEVGQVGLPAPGCPGSSSAAGGPLTAAPHASASDGSTSEPGRKAVTPKRGSKDTGERGATSLAEMKDF